MKLFLRILSYASQLRLRLPLFFFYSILGIIFGALNIVLVIPMLEVLFDKSVARVIVPPVPVFNLSTDYIIGMFNHYFLAIVNEYKEIDYEIMPNLAHRSY